jgi:hypothetical protein
MNAVSGRFNQIMVGFYAWIMAIYMGAVVLDAVYARIIPAPSTALAEAADFLLLMGSGAILAALVAVVFSWKVSAARIFFIASLVVLLGEFLIPMFLAPLIADNEISGAGMLLRIGINGLASILAFIGLGKFYRRRDQEP